MSERTHADLVAARSQSNSATSALAASWRRSLMKHGLDPADRRAPDRLSEGQLARRRQAMSGFLDVATPQLDQLYNLVGLSGCNVMLTDAQGVVLDQRVSDADAQQFRSWGLWVGADWSEAVQGTNGIGTCLAEGRQVTIHRDEHFHTRNTGMSCMDAPIWGPDGRLLAALDVSSARADQTERYNRLISAQVVQTARAIEAIFFRSSFEGARIVMASGVGGDASALLAVDRDDLAVGATRAARRMLGLEREGAIRPRPAADLLGGQADLPALDRAERAALMRALARADGNVTRAARALGIGRATMYRRMSRLGIGHQDDRPSHD
ncbi:helix-turn-helix domain-containing protein [Paracoccus sp. 1_MG-2023]|uniref:GAF domain-containing protein n=1 Tax=unclassified Paracoccus (in: a-proteobacteria) TaxID=2688777 RepID=UPI001C084E84|nr:MULTISPECIES: GAF domain-containing protein [unclassified Paracoccus (in: a-proteobacteria)]MBU2956165.1 GAF domain-containing protein [Paracoccus sp. C2R09]MDO6667841.1 helix-turn-helix domain-containing protein [Paracoccus sp. 1_MG-2023]